MITAIKIIVTLVIMLLLSYPFIPMKGMLKKVSIASSLRYYAPHNRKNFVFLLLSIVEFVAVVLLFKLFDELTALVCGIPWIGPFLSNVANSMTSQVDYVFFAIKLFIVNLLIVYAFVFLKAFFKKAVVDNIYEIGKKKNRKRRAFKKKDKQENEKRVETKSESTDESQAEQEEEKLRKRRRIPNFVHSVFEETEKEEQTEQMPEGEEEKLERRTYGKFMSWWLSFFFEGTDFEYARDWVIRVRMVLQLFIRLVQTVYFLFFVTILISVFFPLPQVIYDILVDVLRVRDWYVYPLISILFLQEICNIFDADAKQPVLAEAKRQAEEKRQDMKREKQIRTLFAELKKRFDADHSLRYYPEITPPAGVPEYECTSVTYASALEFIKKRMRIESGHIVQSYMECLDAIYHDANVYFPASFYSELGEYLIAYIYIRLLSGERLIFVVSNPAEKETLRKYISDRLMKMTGSSVAATWRIYTVDERLDQADVLIATPNDFIDNNIVEQYPGFFEEACNVVFIDADRLITLDSYLCPVVSMRLQRATKGRIRFVFLSLNLIKGFAAGSLPKFFCVDKVLSFSSAKENEAVSYILWNKESKKHRIYNKSVQKLTCLESIIADLACRHGIDGVRLMTEASLEHAERKVLAMHNVEINNLYKNVVDVNYMIYSDDKCNLSAALYACTRFRGRKKSIVHILSKPYLLREYFMSKATTEDHVIRSSFIQPRVTEHAETHKLNLLRIFCDAATESGIPVSEFEARMKEVIHSAIDCNDIISSAYCRQLLKNNNYQAFKTNQLAAYLIAGLCDTDHCITEAEEIVCADESIAQKAKDFYIVVDPMRTERLAPVREKNIIFNRSKEVFDRLLACNDRVELRLNGDVIGMLDTFPTRVHLEYIEGQSIVYNNTEYEIDCVSEDGKTIYLRRENISIKNCLDTILLRNYKINSLEPIEDSAVLNNSKSPLQEIRVTRCKADFEGNTYGFYSLTADRQTLDFYRGVEGNPCVDTPHTRHHINSGTLHVELKARMECTDGMRLLISAVFNEFVRTIFPDAYHSIAICPVLTNPLADEKEYSDSEPEEKIKALYPYIKNSGEAFVETESNRMQFVFINDSVEDVGVLDWFYDHSARYMQEFLANIYSYLHWLKLCPERQHYIYFGGEKLASCFDLEGCCQLLGDYNLILSDEGQTDIETAGDEVINEVMHRCSFCHKQMESGRFFFFDKHRYICADCFNSVDGDEQLEDIYMGIKEYLTAEYPEYTFAPANIKFDGVYELPLSKTLSENYYRIDYSNRTIYVELDGPATNVAVSILRGIIALWQYDNGLANHYSNGQLYYEELQYLRHKGENLSLKWIYENLPYESRYVVDQIKAYIDLPTAAEEGPTLEETEEREEPDAEEEEFSVEEMTETGETDAEVEAETDVEPKSTPELHEQLRRTSFAFMIVKAKELVSEEFEGDEPEGEEFSNDLYDPNQVPRFFKRYLRDQRINDGETEDLPERIEDPSAETPEGTDEGNEVAEETEAEEMLEVEEGSEDNAFVDGNILLDNAPFGFGEDEEESSDEQEADEEGEADSVAEEEVLDPREEKRRKKEEKKRLRAEKQRKKQEEWERKLNKAIEEDEIRRGIRTAPAEESTEDPAELTEKTEKKKWSLFGHKKRVKSEEVEEPITEKEPIAAEEETPEVAEDPEIDEPGEEIPEEASEEPRKTEKKTKKKEKSSAKKLSPGEKILPHESDEDTNPKIRIYNDLVRAAYNYSEDPIDRTGVTDEELEVIFGYVTSDYPELFWINAYRYNDRVIIHNFRCKDANGTLDVKQINRKRTELRKAAKYFTKGITRKTDPYKALLTIYRRVILTLDYDMVGLNAGAGKDLKKDDTLRSLYNALVNHKVVCAGYAVAMQYLLQSVGIVCAYVSSEGDALGSHAFNMLKLGKYCYYLDATWGDMSSTEHNRSKDDVVYNYCCVPYQEFLATSNESERLYHTPSKARYPKLEQFHHANHEYFRYHNAYLKSYNEAELVRIFAETALRYDAKEMGNFSVDIRCANKELAKYVQTVINLDSIVEQAKAVVAKKNKKAEKLFVGYGSYYPADETGVIKFLFANDHRKKKK